MSEAPAKYTRTTFRRWLSVAFTSGALSISTVILLAIVLFLPILIRPGYSFFGDELFSYWSFSSWLETSFFTWSGGPNTGYTWIIQSAIWPLLAYASGHEWASKLALFFLSFLPGIAAFSGTKILLRHWRLVNRSRETPVATLSALLYGAAFYNAGFNPLPSFSWPYIILPLISALFITGLSTASRKTAVAVAFLSVLGSVNPLWLFSFALVAIPFVLRQIAVAMRTQRTLLSCLSWLFLTSSLVLLFNAFWLIPTYAGYALGASGFFSVYTTGNLISFPALFSASRWPILDILLVGHPAYHFFFSFPRNWTLLNVLLPILSFGSLLTVRGRSPSILLLNVIVLMSAFAAKGVQPPFGDFYLLAAQHLPYGAGAILRNVGWGAWSMMFGYSILIPLTVLSIHERFWDKRVGTGLLRMFYKSGSLSKLRASMPVLISIVLVGTLTYGTLADMQVYTYVHFAPVQIPNEYSRVNAELTNSRLPGKVLWVPDTGYYIWHGGDPLTAWPTTISALPSSTSPDFLNLSPFIPPSDVTVPTTRIGKVLSLTDTKYVVFHGDSSYPNRKVLAWLDNQVDLVPLVRLPFEVRFPPVSRLPENLPGYQITTVPLRDIAMPVLARGETTVVVLNYTIPPEVLSRSRTGTFWAGFGIALEVLPAGVQPPVSDLGGRRIAEAFISNQTAISEESGFVGFDVVVPELAAAQEADLYAWYYGGGFEQLSPLYFIARVPIVPSEYQSEFVLYENMEIVSPVFVPRATLVMYGGFQELLLASQLEQFRPRDWSIVLDPPAGWRAPGRDRVVVVTDGTSTRIVDVSQENVIVLASLVRLLGSLAARDNSQNAELPKAVPGYTVESIPFEVIGPLTVNRTGIDVVSVEYSIPQSVLNESGTGEFWTGFGLAFEVVPAGVQPSAAQMGAVRVGESFWQNQRQLTNNTGIVDFVFPALGSSAGSSVDVYSWYYGGSFRALSPFYYLGRWTMKGAYESEDFGLELGPGNAVRLINASVPVVVRVPAAGTYAVAVTSKGNVSLRAGLTEFTGMNDGNWTSFGPLALAAGSAVLEFHTPNDAYLGTFMMFNAEAASASVFEVLKPVDSPASILSYAKVSQTEWLVELDASRPFFLAFAEPFDHLWKAVVGQQVVDSEPLYGMINGFWIDTTGLLQIHIYYTLQKYLDIGLGITGTTVLGGTLLIMAPRIMRRRNTRGRS